VTQGELEFGKFVLAMERLDLKRCGAWKKEQSLGSSLYNFSLSFWVRSGFIDLINNFSWLEKN